MSDKKALIEAALFMAAQPLSLKELSKISGITSEEKIKEILNEIKRDLDLQKRGFELAILPGGYQLRVRQEFLNKVASLTPHSDLSEGMLRTLGIVALKQPATQSDVVKIQGNKAYGYIKELEKRGLIKTEKFGRTRKLITTKEFERYFGKSINEIRESLQKVVGNEGDKQSGINVSDKETEFEEFEDTED
ncbi:MAG: SMC-Scp complex subunit ScpB [Candidatus Aenigmarchaeota archaeon]|nr:SMC-Scp complex subunit ScpB [Candidatus Aenigmarchaeota archaeon]MBU5689368.1 SMC-Scp complex subunit ScpB [Candidatus Aenigmarchaeota archaeon]